MMECCIYRALVVCIAFVVSASATQHTVGGSQGWDVSTDLSSWASAQKIEVGDQLVFKYTTGLHSVVELASESAYKNCDVGSVLDSKNSGNDVVKLNKAGTRYFACGTPGHCQQGMKLKITAAASGSSQASPASSTSSSSGSTTPGASASAAAGVSHVTALLVTTMVVCVLVVYY
ncbi:Blue copper [Tripterygium wilfordii]|uniref:Blue copper n=1 Tax=Tripterygium wilfordii TaxID=458696 RepID=A0A7J7DKV7_TRIWF|nr:mavicyanin [Tripterygium wilfordii]KAF5746938.1 Blue copper [Tripterygium wilfordii]